MILVIDSATAACSVALLDGQAVVAEIHETIGRGHAERLLPEVQDLLQGRRPNEIWVDCGPGSFTGLRVGLAAAQGLAIGWGVPVRGYSSLALIAAAAMEAQPIAIALHGGHGQLFVQTYGQEPIRPLDALQSLLPEEAARAISAPIVIGGGAEALVSARGTGEWRDALPRAADALLLPPALRNLPPKPIYGRGADAKPMA